MKKIISILIMIISSQFPISVFSEENINDKNIKTITFKLDTERDINFALMDIKSDNMALFKELQLLRKSDHELFLKTLNREYYSYLVRKGYDDIRKEDKLSPKQQERILNKKINELCMKYKKETDPQKQIIIRNEMLDVAHDLFNCDLKNEERYIANMKKKLKVVEGRYTHKLQNKNIYIERLVNEKIKS